jgi:hypothetical protein
MEEHPLFNYIRTIEEGKYVSTLECGTEYSLRLTNPRDDFPQVYISYNDLRSYWTPSEDESFEKDGESITYDRLTGDVIYSRFKNNVPSIVNSSFNFPMDISDEYKRPYPQSLEQILDGTLQLLKTAQKAKD